MEDEKPADPAAWAEWNQLTQLGSTHPMNPAFRRNDKHAVEYANQLASRAWPGEREIGGGLQPHIEAGLAKDLGISEPRPNELNAGDKPIAKSAETTPQLSPEEQQVNEEAALALYERHGDRTGSIIARAGNVAQYLEGTTPMWSRVCKAAIAKGITKDVMIEILDESGIEYGFDDKQKDET